MTFSRIWYAILSLALGAAVALLFVAAALYNRAGDQAMHSQLEADASALDWYLRDDARKRSAYVVPVAVHPEVRAFLAKASTEAKLGRDVQNKTSAVLKKLAADLPDDGKADALWAVDANGRVVGAVGIEQDDWELGGYAVVADALHGWSRDDAWVWNGRILRVVARPVETEAGGEPVGAVVAAKYVDEAFAKGVSARTGATVAFYADRARCATGDTEGMQTAVLDQITRDLGTIEEDVGYSGSNGRSKVRKLTEHVGVVYTRLPGEAWQLGAGFAVARQAGVIDGPLGFLRAADAGAQATVPLKLLIPAALVLLLLGLGFTYFEHDVPRQLLAREAKKFAKGDIPNLAPSSLRGAYKKIAADLNDGIDKAAEKGGGSRRPADLDRVLGPLPAQPAMSAFSLVEEAAPPPPAPKPRPSAPSIEAPKAPPPKPRTPPPVAIAQTVESEAPPLSLRDGDLLPESQAAPSDAAPASDPASEKEAAPSKVDDEASEWKRVYEEFLETKRSCGEPTSGLSFEKFKGTLQRNKDAIVAKHGAARVKFVVYVKEGKAALKASPVK